MLPRDNILSLKDYLSAFVFALIVTAGSVISACAIFGSILWVTWRITNG